MLTSQTQTSDQVGLMAFMPSSSVVMDPTAMQADSLNVQTLQQPATLGLSDLMPDLEVKPKHLSVGRKRFEDETVVEEFEELVIGEGAADAVDSVKNSAAMQPL